jgi:hypothetical protein
MPSFTIRNSNHEEVRNEINYNSRNGITVVDRGNPGASSPLLLDDFNTIHYYNYTDSGSPLDLFEISTIMLENAVYEVKFNCSGSSDSNNDLLLTPNSGDYNSSWFYSVFTNNFDYDGLSALKYASTSNPEGFYFDFYAGSFGYDPVGKITIFNRRSNKKVTVEVGDTASVTSGSGYWLNNSGTAEDYAPSAVTPPPYNATDSWTTVGDISFADGNFTDWTIYVSRIA